MKYAFACYGHENITARHKKTLEFTKDGFVTKTGDCIVGCKADFDIKKIRKFIGSCLQKKRPNKKNFKALNTINENSIDSNKLQNKKKISNSVKNVKVKIRIGVNDEIEEIFGCLNPNFNDENELVVRTTEFVSERTLVFKADKAAADIKEGIRARLCRRETKIFVALELL